MWLLLLLDGCAALAQQPGPVVQTSDPLVGVITQLLGSSPVTAVLVAAALAYFGGPKMAPRLGLGPDLEIRDTLKRHNRDIWSLRKQAHWQAQVLTSLALKADIKVPSSPLEDPDSDEPR